MLSQLGLEFRVVAAGFDEHTAGVDPVAVVTANALGKARNVAERAGVPQAGAILAADTEVVRDGLVLGKPADRAAAETMLAALAGRPHEVITGVALITGAGERTAHETTRVVMRPLTMAEIRWYSATGEWRDRAGGYAIQGAGAALCARIDGDPSNVVGLPMALVARLLGEAGLWPARGAG
jgi:septum formation protein